MSVLTAGEGSGLEPIAAGLVRRYAAAGEEPHKLLYVDRDCCTQSGRQSNLQSMFAGWDTLTIRLDIWHFMRRFAVGRTTDAYPLYGTFVSCLSACIFEWGKKDLEELRQAKRSELACGKRLLALRSKDVDHHINKHKMAQHCRRRTWGAEVAAHLIEQLLRTLDGDAGCDTMGVPLLDHNKIWAIWNI